MIVLEGGTDILRFGYGDANGHYIMNFAQDICRYVSKNVNAYLNMTLYGKTYKVRERPIRDDIKRYILNTYSRSDPNPAEYLQLKALLA
jgi:uncharacterized cupin superfamily protein